MKVFVPLLVLTFLTVSFGATVTFSGLLRDFCGLGSGLNSNTCIEHPQFECCIGNSRGAVETTLDSNGKPKLKTDQAYPTYPASSSLGLSAAQLYDRWWSDNPAPTNSFPTSAQFPIDIVLSNVGNPDPRVFTYNNGTFWPLTGRGFNDPRRDNNNILRNFHFSMELRGRFSYQGGELFTFTGDDDLWVFINNKLIMDLGGVHGAQTSTVRLDDIANSIGLVRGSNYPIAFFYAERHVVQSNLRIDTTLEIFCAFTDRCGVCEGTGTSCPCTCNDNNPCTVDTCGLLGGCVFTPKNCASNDPCQVGSCDGQGNCILTPVVCNDNNPCTDDSCAAGLGCRFTAKNCDDNNVCTIDSCNGQGNCVNAPRTCNDGNPCTDDSCVNPGGCQFLPKVCPGPSCAINTCNSTGSCVSDNSNCDACAGVTCTPQDACHTVACVDQTGQKQPGTGVCVQTPISCNDGNPCTVDTCNPQSGCSFVPKDCGGDACNLPVCDAETGACSTVPFDCNDNNFCTDDSCTVDGNTAQCNHVVHVCEDNDPCTQNICDAPPGTNQCIFPPLNCDDGSACTTDKCDAAHNGCFYENACLGDACQDSTCAGGQCVLFSKGCPINAEGGVDCWTVTCDAAAGGCQPPQQRTTDSAPNCAFLLLPPAAKAGVISGGVIAAIVIAIVVFVVLSVIGAKKGYDYWKGRQTKMTGVQSNPLYVENQSGGENPMFVAASNA